MKATDNTTDNASTGSASVAEYDTSALQGDTNIANVAIETIVTAKARMGEAVPQLVKLRMMEKELNEQKKSRTKDGKKQTALLTMDEIAESMIATQLKAMTTL